MVERRYLLGGIDSDTAYQNIEKDALLNTVNARTVVSRTQNSTNVKFIAGNTEMENFYEATIYSAYQPHTFPTEYPHGLEPRYVEKGKCVDGTDIYYFLQDYNAYPNVTPFTYTTYAPSPIVTAAIPHESKIVKYDTLAKKATIILSEYWTDANLTQDWGLLTNNFIDCGVSDGKLFWTDRVPRYIDLTIDYFAEYTNSGSGGALPNYANNYGTAGGYTALTTFSADLLSLITEPTVVPLVTIDGTDSTVSSLIQFKALQFCVRLTNQSGFYSVLSPYSLTKLPVRQDEIIANGTDYHNIVGVQLPVTQKIPLNWQTIEYIVRDIETNGFYCIHTWERDSAADVVEVNNHNDGSIPLTFAGYYGINKYAIDSGSIAKQFDSVPLTASSLALVANRLLLGDVTDGYDTNNENSGFLNITQNLFNTVDASINNTATIYLIYVQLATSTTFYYAMVVTFGGKNYLLPKEFNSANALQVQTPLSATTIDALKQTRFFNFPNKISKYALTEMSDSNSIGTAALGFGAIIAAYAQARLNIVAEAIGGGVTFTYGVDLPYMWSGGTVDILDDADFEGAGNEVVCFQPNTSYKLGLQFYDGALRKSGIREYDNIDISNYGVDTKSLTETIDVQVTNVSPSPVPDWAKYFSVTLSKEQKSNKTISFVPSSIKVVVKNSQGDSLYGGYDFITNTPSSYKIYGIAISLTSLSGNGYGYDYKSGDYVELNGLDSGSDTPVLYGLVLSVQDGYVVVEYDTAHSTKYAELISSSDKTITLTGSGGTAFALQNAGTNRQNIVVANLYEDIPDTNDYEVAAFGECSNSQFGNFFASGTDTITINGDHYTQARNSSGGAFTVPSYTPNEVQAKYVINNTGRVCAEDRIGQKYLPTAIRWSNTFIPSAQINGYASFDSNDIKVLEPTADKITRLIPTTKGVTEGSQLLVLCTGGSFVTLVGKAQLFGADQQTAAISATNNVLGEVNPLTGNWTCQSPKSAVTYQGLTFWADSQNRDIIQFGANGATPISAMCKGSRLFRALFTQYDWGVGADFNVTSVSAGVITAISLTSGGFGYREGYYENVPITGGTISAKLNITVGSEGIITAITLASGGTGYSTGHYTTKTVDKEYYINGISGSVNPYTNEYMILFPTASPLPTMPKLATTSIDNPFDCYTPNASTYIYNWNLNKWVSRYENTGSMINVGDDVYSSVYLGVDGYPSQWVNRLWREFYGVAGDYYGIPHNCMISIPFNGDYPTVKAPLAINGDMSRPPDEVWIEADGMKRLNSTTIGVANTQVWVMREGDAMTNILRDRRSLGDDDTKYAIAGIKGNRLKGKTINVCLIWYGDVANPNFTCSTVSLKSEVASGHT